MKVCQEQSQNSTGFGPHMAVASAETVEHSSFLVAKIYPSSCAQAINP
jgi:hypothetical protein